MRTALYDRHCELGAKMASFAGWDMPIQYKGILAEHQAVRQAVGLFDVSHMGRILVSGPMAEQLLDRLSTNRIAGKPPFSATYTVWCNDQGGCLDDVIVYRIDQTHFFVIVNAGNRQKDLEHLKAHAQELEVTIEDCYAGSGILALQGPHAKPLLASFFPQIEALKPMHFLQASEKGENFYISRTGYTGAGGYEMYASNEVIISLWDRLLEKGAVYQILPAGLGARDTLRLEMGFALYGHELSDTIYPNETVSAWTIKWDKADFIGKEKIEQLEKNPSKRRAYGVKLTDPGIPRQGYAVLKGDKKIGEVTSGSFSPTLNQAIALILVDAPLQIEEEVAIQIRQNLCHAHVVQLPFVRKNA
ncbi:glycine cleavage system aminomethyltransferase GcvT [Candidatus Protochlamydia phocaeensis]|uniref:glycine cleavage system aminomethyltransferase GcvT n=1 Tax=Candidatus Protochlamydia phocaeensis TaxID=1414722 RepID=UPI0008394BC0|nr:glycine cleavage system aminomethyltransferase GcvT [Candidatus Protochlamydia phocaeensis]